MVIGTVQTDGAPMSDRAIRRIRPRRLGAVWSAIRTGPITSIAADIVLVACIGANVVMFGFDLARWDLLLVSGLVILIVGLSLAGTMERRFVYMVERLRRRGALVISDATLKDLKVEVHRRARAWARRAAPLGALAMFGTWMAATLDASHDASLLEVFRAFAHGTGGIPFCNLATFEIVFAYVAGLHLGRMASYGSAGMLFVREHCTLDVKLGHLDGVAGLKPVGDFYCFQALVAGLPALYLAGWSVAIPMWQSVYSPWEGVYVFVLLPIAVAVEILAFLVPLVWFHREMVKQKQVLLLEADMLSADIVALEQKIMTASAEEITTLKERISVAKDRYWLIEGLPTWPVDLKARRLLRLQSAAFVLPIVGQALGHSEIGTLISDVMRGSGH